MPLAEEMNMRYNIDGLIYWAPTRKHRGWILHKDSPSPPPAPDYAAQARTQGAANLQSTIAGSILNRPNEVTPYGTKTWTPSGTYTVPGAEGNAPVDIPMFNSSIEFSPLGQQRFDQEQRINTQLGGLAESGIGRVQEQFGTPFDMSKVPDMPVTPDVAGREAVTAALLERQAPQMQRARMAKENNLLIQGHNRGGEAWNASQDDLNRGENDARLAAIVAGGQEQSRLFGLGTTARERAIQEQSTLRNIPLNEINALRTGAQITNPTFSGNVPVGTPQAGNFAQAGQLQGQYDQGLYNSQVAQANQGNQALATGVGTALMFLSDRRLKRNIKRIGTHRLGIGVYSYDYVWGQSDIGVMADEVLEVMPEAVSMFGEYMAVDYGKL